MYACFGLIHLPRTESTRSETHHQLSQHRVNAEWDSTPTESPQKAPTFTEISSFRIDSVDVESHSALTHSSGASLGVDSVDGEWGSVSPPNVKKFEQVGEFKRTKSKLKSLVFGLYMFDQCKKPEKKISSKWTFKREIFTWCRVELTKTPQQTGHCSYFLIENLSECRFLYQIPF
jgi:hypothetical protein